METLTINIPEEKPLLLSIKQQQEIISSQKQIENGLFFDHAALEDEITEWIKI